MDVQTDEERGRSPWPTVASSAVRAAFGVIWAINAALTWQSMFAAHYVRLCPFGRQNTKGRVR